MTHYRMFIKMLEDAGIGHGIRNDHNPDGFGVQVEDEEIATDDDMSCKGSSEFWFDEYGRLVRFSASGEHERIQTDLERELKARDTGIDWDMDEQA